MNRTSNRTTYATNSAYIVPKLLFAGWYAGNDATPTENRAVTSSGRPMPASHRSTGLVGRRYRVDSPTYSGYADPHTGRRFGNAPPSGICGLLPTMRCRSMVYRLSTIHPGRRRSGRNLHRQFRSSIIRKPEGARLAGAAGASGSEVATGKH